MISEYRSVRQPHAVDSQTRYGERFIFSLGQ